MEGESTDAGQQLFSHASNNLNLIAPAKALLALQAFQDGIKVSNQEKVSKDYDTLVADLFYEIRKDIGISTEDASSDLKIRFWASGVKTKSGN